MAARLGFSEIYYIGRSGELSWQSDPEKYRRALKTMRRKTGVGKSSKRAEPGASLSL